MTNLAWELTVRAARAQEQLAACRFCRHACGIDRLFGQAGRCGAGADARYFYAGINYAVEAPWSPQFSLFFTACGLRCAGCWARDHVLEPGRGREFRADELAELTAAATAAGVRSLGLLGGSPVVNIAAALAYLAVVPATLPLVWNSEGREHDAARELLAGLVDEYAVSVKFGNDNCARRHAQAPDYLAGLRTNLRWMARETRTVACLLIMPGHDDCCGAPARALLAELPGLTVREEPYALTPPVAAPPAWSGEELTVQIRPDGCIVCPIVNADIVSAASEFAILSTAEARR